jgi:hypothetical protein
MDAITPHTIRDVTLCRFAVKVCWRGGVQTCEEEVVKFVKVFGLRVELASPVFVRGPPFHRSQLPNTVDTFLLSYADGIINY